MATNNYICFFKIEEKNEGERRHAKTMYYIFLRKGKKHARNINTPVKIQITIYINVHGFQPVGYPSGAIFFVRLLCDWYEWSARDQQPTTKNENRNKLFSSDFDFTLYVILGMASSRRISAKSVL